MIPSLAPRWCRVLLLCTALLVAGPRQAAAEWQFAPFFGWDFSGHTSFFDFENATDDMHRAFGLTVTRINRGPFGFEGTAVYVPGFFNDPKLQSDRDKAEGSRVYALMGNVVVAAPQGWNEYGLRPYVSGGVGALFADEDLIGLDGQVFQSIHQKLFGANIGGGAVGFLTDRTGVRFDLRFFTNVRNVADTDVSTVGARKHLRFWMASIGLVLR